MDQPAIEPGPQRWKAKDSPVFFCGATAELWLRPLASLLRSLDHTQHTHKSMVGLLWLIDRHVSEVASWITHNKQEGRTSIPSAGFESAIPAVRRLQTYALDRTTTATWYGHCFVRRCKSCRKWRFVCGWVVFPSKRPALLFHRHSHIPVDLTVQQRRCDNLKDWCVGCITADITNFTCWCPRWAALFCMKFPFFYGIGIFNAVSTTTVRWLGAE